MKARVTAGMLRFPSWRWEDRSHVRHLPQALPGLARAYVNDLYAVQWWERDTEWGAVIHLVIQRQDGEPVRNWAHLQRIKDELVGPERVAVEVFPPASELVDDAHLYHLWVLPDGFRLPFGLDPSWGSE